MLYLFLGDFEFDSIDILYFLHDNSTTTNVWNTALK